MASARAAAPGACTLRGYQSRIADSIDDKNSIVVLPTGSGKTFIFAELCHRALRRRAKAVVFVPKQILVEQQAKEVRRYLASASKESYLVGQFMGGEQLPQAFDVLVSTPKAFQIAQGRPENSRLRWENFGLVVFDEVHHCLRNDPYRQIALKLPLGSGLPLKVCGVTASLSYAVDEAKMRKSVDQLRLELKIQVLETASVEELKQGGYHACGVETEFAQPGREDGQRSPPLADTRGPASSQPLPVADRKPHLMLPTFWQRYERGQSTRFASGLVHIVKMMEAAATQLDAGFASPLFGPKKLKLAEWASFAYDRKLKASGSADLTAVYEGLQTWYDALRLSINSWEEEEELVVIFLRMKGALRAAGRLPAALRAPVEAFLANHAGPDAAHPRCDALLQELHQKRQEITSRGEQLRGLVFVEQRLVAHVVDYFLQGQGVASAPLYAANAPASAELSVPRSRAVETLRQFRTGSVQILVTTTVAEEGLDVPEANLVIRFDGVLNAVSYVQGRGRARQEGAAQVVMRERNGRTVGDLEAIEGAQRGFIESVAASGSFDDPAARAAHLQKAQQAQQARERTAADGLKKFFAGSDLENAALAALGLFCAKTKVSVEETYGRAEALVTCTLKYESCLRSLTATGGAASNQKAAKKLAALQLLSVLRTALGA